METTIGICRDHIIVGKMEKTMETIGIGVI